MRIYTIPKTAPVVGIPEFQLRRMQKEGKLPGFFSGTRFYINVDMLEAQLAAECAANAANAKHIGESART